MFSMQEIRAKRPVGRPRRPPTLAAALREAFPIERLVAIAEEMILSPSEDVRTKAWLHIMERAHGKVADKLELGPPGSLADDRATAAQLTDAQLDALDALDRQRDAILLLNDGADGSSPASEIARPVEPLADNASR